MVISTDGVCRCNNPEGKSQYINGVAPCISRYSYKKSVYSPDDKSVRIAEICKQCLGEVKR